MNDQAEWCSGIGGAGVYWEGGAIWAADAGGAQWFTRDLVIGGRTDGGTHRLASYNVRTAALVDPIYTGALSEIKGSAHGHWVVQDPSGLTDSLGRHNAVARVSAGPLMGPDGSYAHKRHFLSTAWDVLEVGGGLFQISAIEAYDIVNYGNRRLSWRDAASTPRAYGMPVPIPISIPYFGFRYVFVGSELWQLYQADDARLVFHPRGDRYGYAVDPGPTIYAPCGFMLTPTTVRIAWSTNEGEAAAFIGATTIDLTSAPIALSSASVPLPEPTPPSGCS
jgi:hypothetical protein